MKKLIINSCSAFMVFLCLFVETIQAQESIDSLVNIAFGVKEKKDLLGAISTVNIEELLKLNYQTYTLDGIRSFVGGYTGGIWGQNPLVLVDGVPRDASDLNATEVASITILKGANAVVLYGSRAAKGVILITTKRGKEQPLTIEARANAGMFVPKRYPKYLDAASYMTLYNEASDNDGLPPLYSEETIYYTAEGQNPYRYPDINFFSSDYLRDFYNNIDATVEISGGGNKTQYYTNFGVNYNNDIIKYGEQEDNHDLNFRVRGNVDIRLTSWLSAKTDAYAIFNNNYIGRGDFWGSSSTIRPNWFTPLVPIDLMNENDSELASIIENSNNIIDGKFLLGGNNAVQTNALADMLAAGYIRYKDRVFQFKVSTLADLSGITKGLTFNSAFSLDYNNYYSEAYRVGYATYMPVWANMNGEDKIIGLTKYGDDTSSTNEYIGDSRFKKTMSFFSQFNYDRTFANIHNVSGNLIAWGFQTRNSVDSGHDGSDYHSTSNANLGIQASYNYLRKYYFDFSGSIVHSSKLPEGKRVAFSPTISLGWRISDETFMKALSFIDDLKLTGSYGLLNQDIDIEDYYMYQGYYDDSAWYQWRDGTMGGFTVISIRGSNPDLSFITREEFRFGLEGALMNNKIKLDINYFNQVTDGLLTQGAATLFPSYFDRWDFSYLPYINFNKDKRTGLDFSLSYNNNVGNFNYGFGVVGMLYDSEALVRDEVYQDEYQYRVGKPLDAAFGYICEGFFENQADIENHAIQTFGDVMPGDLKYRDVNNDGVVDTRDQVYLGKSGNGASPFNYGIHLKLNYKNWTLFAMGQGQSGAIGFKNSSYFWVYGSRKYSEVVMGRWTPETANTATYPRLTTTSNSNNFRNSTFWMYDNNRFDLTKIQLNYDFPETFFNDNSLVSQLSLYLSGQNLITISKEREMMEMNIGSEPQYRFYNFGIKATF